MSADLRHRMLTERWTLTVLESQLGRPDSGYVKLPAGASPAHLTVRYELGRPPLTWRGLDDYYLIVVFQEDGAVGECKIVPR